MKNKDRSQDSLQILNITEEKLNNFERHKHYETKKFHLQVISINLHLVYLYLKKTKKQKSQNYNLIRKKFKKLFYEFKKKESEVKRK